MKQKGLIIGIILVFLVSGVLSFFYFKTRESGVWICQNGEWVKQGEPAGPKPEGECQEGEKFGEMAGEKELVFDQAKFEKSQELAREAVLKSATYKFDGYGLKFESSQELTCSNCWEFVYSFSSRYAGYGNRTSQILAQVVTLHQIRVNVDDEEIVAVVTDRTFDELRETYLK